LDEGCIVDEGLRLNKGERNKRRIIIYKVKEEV